MPYGTHHKLTYEPQADYVPAPNCLHEQNFARFCSVCGAPAGTKDLTSEVARYLKQRNLSCYLTESFAWYQRTEDMLAMSEAFPGVLFKLHGEGDDNDDIWDAYFLNGRYQYHKAHIVIDPFDPDKWDGPYGKNTDVNEGGSDD